MLKARKALGELFEAIYEIMSPKASEECKESTQIDTPKPTKQIILVKLNPLAKSIVQRCADLFFFYQTDEPFVSLQLHDYGFFQYEQFENYMTDGRHRATLLSQPFTQIDLGLLTEEHPYLKPIFRTRQ